jgi:hypothetical protein
VVDFVPPRCECDYHAKIRERSDSLRVEVERLKAEKLALAEEYLTRANEIRARCGEHRGDSDRELASLRAALAKAEALAYIGEHRHEDLTWKARCAGEVEARRAAETKLAKATEALEAIASGPSYGETLEETVDDFVRRAKSVLAAIREEGS